VDGTSDGTPERLRTLLTPVLGCEADCFISAGLAAVNARRERRWVQLGVRTAGGHNPELLRQLQCVAVDLLAGQAINFFYMYKPPGLRIRFEADPQNLTAVESRIRGQLGPLAEALTPALYEPEDVLFGGRQSMAFVHRLFTIDSLAWLAFAQAPTATPRWAFSLALVRRLLGGLGIVGWEDLGVWDRIANQAGRRLPPGLSGDRVVAVGQDIRELWLNPRTHDAALDAAAIDVVERWGPPLAIAAQDWSSGYFETRAAVIGPREGAAFAIIFHWNRGRLGAGVQALLTSSLSDRAGRS
jgi:thiopeptide-type bacteriocin biosynthesis protein